MEAFLEMEQRESGVEAEELQALKEVVRVLSDSVAAERAEQQEAVRRVLSGFDAVTASMEHLQATSTPVAAAELELRLRELQALHPQLESRLDDLSRRVEEV